MSDPSGTLVGAGSLTYEVDPQWEKPPHRWVHTDVSAIAVDSADRVFVLNRGEPPIGVYDPDGSFVGSWGKGIFTHPHGLAIGPDDGIYCVDDADHTVRKFNRDGLVIQTIRGVSTDGAGAEVRSSARTGQPFDGPTDVAVGPTGDFYVSDGYGNARVHCFSRDGALRFSWGEPGSGPGQFNLPHGIALARDGKVFVADRENDRIQVFDHLGNYIQQWTDLVRPDGVAVDRDDNVYVVELSRSVGERVRGSREGPPSRCSIFDVNGRLLARWGTRDSCAAGSFFAPHGICVDSKGDLYVGEVIVSGGANVGKVRADCHTLQKFVRVSPKRES